MSGYVLSMDLYEGLCKLIPNLPKDGVFGGRIVFDVHSVPVVSLDMYVVDEKGECVIDKENDCIVQETKLFKVIPVDTADEDHY